MKFEIFNASRHHHLQHRKPQVCGILESHRPVRTKIIQPETSCPPQNVSPMGRYHWPIAISHRAVPEILMLFEICLGCCRKILAWITRVRSTGTYQVEHSPAGLDHKTLEACAPVPTDTCWICEMTLGERNRVRATKTKHPVIHHSPTWTGTSRPLTMEVTSPSRRSLIAHRSS